MEFTAESIKSKLTCSCNVALFDEVTSTNDIAKELAENGAREGTVVISRSQTSGRGRKGHTFFSPPDTGIYMSIVLRPQINPAESLLITTAAALSTAEAIEKITGGEAKIKWVNDVFVNGKKVSGILTEASLSADLSQNEWVILGIGVNVSPPEKGFPDEINGVAGAVVPAGSDIRADLSAELLNTFFGYYKDLKAPSIYYGYKKRMFLFGKTVSVIRQEGNAVATVIGLDDSFRLLVRYKDGRSDVLSSGEVSVKPEDAQ